MATQTATTGNLENCSNAIIAKARFTMEHNQPCVELVEHLRLGKGEKSLYIPKVGQMTASALTDGVDMVASEDIGVTGVTLTTSEVGLKVVLTDKLVRQFSEDVWAIVGRQMGDGMARKKDRDVIALFSALNGATVLGADNKNMTFQNVQACIAWAKANKLPRPISIVHQPYAVTALRNSVGTTGGTYPFPQGISQDLLNDFWAMTYDGIGIFHDGNIDKIAGVDSGYGAIFSKNAMCVIESMGMRKETERDASLRADELVVVSDYGCFEIDDGYGAAMQYEIGALSTSN